MRRGTSRRMPRKSAGLTDRLTLPIKPELLREIDQVRGDVPARGLDSTRACVSRCASSSEAAREGKEMIRPFELARFG